MPRFIVAVVLAAFLAASPLMGRDASAQSDTAMVQSTIYFGMESPDGGVSEQEWSTFLADEVTPRFPDGLTVLSAYGQGTSTKASGVLTETTKMLVIVHPDTAEATGKLGELKSIYKERFHQTGVFHTRQPVEVVAD
ncbi:hypothetical protein AB7M35_001625 [Amorphus suaedae]